uniref:Protein kinase domain-containing protein n=1 Tax=Panagrellus redivivus TaxID=6233 RepID=A0A7E4UUU2_PANRE
MLHRISAPALLITLFILRCGAKKIKLNNDKAQTVNFPGDKLEIEIDNHSGHYDKPLIVCLESTGGVGEGECPNGYLSIPVFTTDDLKIRTVTVNRDGSVFTTDVQKISGSVRFGEDGSVRIMVKKIPEDVTVTLLNAKKVASTTETPESGKSAVIIGSIVGTVAIVIMILIIVGGIIYCVLRKKRAQNVPANAPENNVPSMIVVEKRGSTQVNEQPPSTVPQPLAEPQHTPMTTPPTKPSNEKVTLPAPTPIQKVSSTPAPQVEPKPVPTNTTPVPPKTTPTTVPKPESVKKVTSAPETMPKPKSALPTETISATTVENEKSPPIKTDKTQVATQRSLTTEPTPDFTRDGNGNALAKNSVCKARKYMHPSEAPRPGQPRRRVRPVVDEVEHFKRGTETYLCFCQRHGKLGGHNHWLLVRRIDPTGAHKPSYAERMLLKAAPKDAPKWADQVVREAKARISEHCLYKDFEQLGYDEELFFWHGINDWDTPASDGLVALYKLAPELFALEEQSLADPLIKIMPLCGIYTLILDQSFSTSFRIELAAELRNRASKVIPYIQPDALREAAFPAPYMARAFMKNNRSFIEGKEIHSKSSRMDEMNAGQFHVNLRGPSQNATTGRTIWR